MPLKGDAKISALQNALKVQRAVEMRQAHCSWQQIADELGWASKGAAFTQVDRYMKAVIAETTADVEVYRHESLETLRELIRGLWPRRTDEKVAAEIRRCRERMDKLTGAEVITVQLGESDVDRALRELDAQIAGRAAGAARQAGPSA